MLGFHLADDVRPAVANDVLVSLHWLITLAFCPSPCPYTQSAPSSGGENSVPLRDGLGVEIRRTGVTARSLLARGPRGSDLSEDQRQTVPVSNRTARKVQEKVVPRRTGIRATGRSRSVTPTPEGGMRMRYILGVDWADTTHAVWVVDEGGTKVATRTVPHTAEGLSEWGRELDEWRARGIELWAGIERPDDRGVGCLLGHGGGGFPVEPQTLD